MAASTTEAPVTMRWTALGTSVVLRVRGCDGDGAERARRAVESELGAIDLACSRFRADSELTRLNERAGQPTPVGPVLLDALELAMRAAYLSDGDVDPTIGGSLVALGYDRDWSELDTGSGARSLAATGRWRLSFRRAGWREVSVDGTRAIVTVPRGIRLDLGATAKAWAADRAAGAAARAAACGALVAIGGDIATAGTAPAEGWLVRVADDHRHGEPGLPGQNVTIRSGGLATSSTTVRRWYTRRGEAHHLIDPRNGRPVRGRWRTVSVAAGSCADANIASTAAIVRSDRACAWLEAQRLPARLVDQRGNTTEIAGWPAP
jgi:thiamine biosynthesis lipoprotein